jgi:hypothetical protein
MIISYKIYVRQFWGEILLEIHVHTWEDNIEILKQYGLKVLTGVSWLKIRCSG